MKKLFRVSGAFSEPVIIKSSWNMFLKDQNYLGLLGWAIIPSLDSEQNCLQNQIIKQFFTCSIYIFCFHRYLATYYGNIETIKTYLIRSDTMKILPYKILHYKDSSWKKFLKRSCKTNNRKAMVDLFDKVFIRYYTINCLWVWHVFWKKKTIQVWF